MKQEVVSVKQYLVDELLYEIADRLRVKAMFGGYGLYLDNRIFGVISSSGTVYFKVGDNNRQDYEARGSKPFAPEMKNMKRSMSMPYYELPEEIFDDPEQAVIWAEKAALNSQ